MKLTTKTKDKIGKKIKSTSSKNRALRAGELKNISMEVTGVNYAPL